jgi:cysteine synthase A
MDEIVQQKLNSLKNVIGNTPMTKIIFKYKGKFHNIYAKLEYYNYSGSIKDRMAYHILKDAYENGTIKQGNEISEATSGNTGIAFAALGSYLGHKVNIFMPDWMSIERVNMIKSLGATIIPVSKEEGGFLGSIQKSKDYAKKGNVFLPLQFENNANRMAHYISTGPEIWNQMEKFKATPDGFTVGVGTGGTVMGIGDYLKEKNPNCKVYPMEPANSPTLTTGGKKIGSHRIQGISDEFIPDIVKLERLNEIIPINDGESIIMAQMLAKVLGMGVGISSGGNFLAALKIQLNYGIKNAVTVFADDNKKYLSTDYSREEPVKDGFLTNDIELVSYESVR